MQEQYDVPLAPLTTLRLGGPAAGLTTAGSSCGVIPTAMAKENSNASMNGLCSATLITKIDVVKARLIRDYGYNETSATDVLTFVASIFARGHTKK